MAHLHDHQVLILVIWVSFLVVFKQPFYLFTVYFVPLFHVKRSRFFNGAEDLMVDPKHREAVAGKEIVKNQ